MVPTTIHLIFSGQRMQPTASDSSTRRVQMAFGHCTYSVHTGHLCDILRVAPRTELAIRQRSRVTDIVERAVSSYHTQQKRCRGTW
jgi:hypothetical protein